MPLFGKNDDKPKLIETVGPVPEGYRVEKILFDEEVTSSGVGSQQKIVNELRKKCANNGFDGFANLKFAAAADANVVTLFGSADAIKQN